MTRKRASGGVWARDRENHLRRKGDGGIEPADHSQGFGVPTEINLCTLDFMALIDKQFSLTLGINCGFRVHF